MACRNLRFEIEADASSEWVPMALREGTCALRKSDPEKWNQVLRCEGVEVEDSDVHCMHNLEGSFHTCPLHVERNPAPQPTSAPEESEQEEEDVPRNEHGVPLLL